MEIYLVFEDGGDIEDVRAFTDPEQADHVRGELEEETGRKYQLEPVELEG